MAEDFPILFFNPFLTQSIQDSTPAPAPTPADSTAAAFNLLITSKAPDADLSSPPPLLGLLNTPWINGSTISTGVNQIPASASSPGLPVTESAGNLSNGGASGTWNVGTPLDEYAAGGLGGIPNLVESWVTGYNAADLQAQSTALDNQLAAMNQQALATGTIDDATYNTTVQHLATQIAATQAIPADINAAWVDGALAGYQSDLTVLNSIPKYAGKVTGDVLGAILTGTGSGIGSILGKLPWWIYVGGALALFVYLGGGKAVEYQARKRIARYAR